MLATRASVSSEHGVQVHFPIKFYFAPIREKFSRLLDDLTRAKSLPSQSVRWFAAADRRLESASPASGYNLRLRQAACSPRAPQLQPAKPSDVSFSGLHRITCLPAALACVMSSSRISRPSCVPSFLSNGAIEGIYHNVPAASAFSYAACKYRKHCPFRARAAISIARSRGSTLYISSHHGSARYFSRSSNCGWIPEFDAVFRGPQ